MRILFLMPHCSTGGMPAFVLKRIQAIINNDDFEIFVVEYSNFSDHYVVQKNQIRSIVKPENFFTLEGDKHMVIDIIKNNNIDIVHIDEILEGFGQEVPANLFNDLYDNNRTWKIIETCHNIWFDPNNNKKFNPDAYAFCTPWHKEITFSKMPSYSEVIQFPIEDKIPSFEKKITSKIKLGFDVGKKHVINVGLWTAGKNQKEGIELAKLLEHSNPDIHFHFIGNQAINFEDYWRPIMQNLPSNVTIWGEREDIDTFMEAADIFMFNSTWECNPLVLKEAVSHGLKILSRNLPQYMDMFTKYITPIDDDLQTTLVKLLGLLNSNSNYKVIDELKSFKDKYSEFYKRVFRLPAIENSNFIPKPNIIQNFICNPFIEIKGTSENKFKIEFYDETGRCHYSETLPINHWVKLNREYYTKWNTKVWENNNLIYDETINLNGKRVFITLESRSLGDNLAWFPYIEEFRKQHNCTVIASTFMNNIFIESYPEIIFVEPGTAVHNLYAMYKIGWFYKDDDFDVAKNPNDFRSQPMQKTSSDILGLEYKEIKPKIKRPVNIEKKKKVGIAIHATCQAKYWNNPVGWQSVVNYLKELNYEVVLYSRENDGYMGNYQPIGVNKFESGSIENLIEDMSSCEFFIGLGSGLSWLAWSLDIPVILISGFSEEYSETTFNTYRVINKNVCHGCFNNHKLNGGDWYWCPEHKGTSRQFECTKNISPEMVISEINKLLAYEKSKHN